MVGKVDRRFVFDEGLSARLAVIQQTRPVIQTTGVAQAR